MVPSGPPTPIGNAHSVPPSLLRSNSGMVGAQGGPLPSQAGFPSLVSPHSQFNNVNMLGNMSNVSSLLNQSFGEGVPNSGLQGPGSTQRQASNMAKTGSSSQGPGSQFSNLSSRQLLSDQLSSQQLESQNFQPGQHPVQTFSASNNNQQQQFQAIRGGVVPVKLEPQVSNNDQHGQPLQQQSLRNLTSVKLEPQQLQSMRTLSSVKLEPQQSDQSPFLHQQQQQQQQQQFLHMSRQTSQAAAAQINQLHQQRLLQLQQQHQQQQLLKAIPQQRPQLQQQFQLQNQPLRPHVKQVYEPGMCARRLTHYMYQQQHRPEDNNIEFWRKFVAEYFAPHAKKKWCVSMYGSGRQTTGVFPQDVWHCEICNRKTGRGFEATAEVLPRLFKIKYESGTLEELLYVDMPSEYHNSSGQIVLDYAKAIQESVFEQLRVVRDGQLRIVFSPDLKICSWEFCARRHEELIPRRLLIPQVRQLEVAAQKYQTSVQNVSSNLSSPELQTNCNVFVASTRQLEKALEVPLVNDLGYTKRYVRCLQISEVVNSMKDLIDYSRETGTGPIESLAKFPRRSTASPEFHSQAQQAEEQLQHQQQQQPMAQNSNCDQSSVQAASNGVASVNNSINQSSATTSASTIVGLLHQNSINSRQKNSMGNSVQISAPSSSGMILQAQSNTSSFQSPTPSPNHPPQPSHGTISANNSMQRHVLSAEADPQSSVQKIIQEYMMSNQLNGTGNLTGVGSLTNEAKNVMNGSAGYGSVNGGLGQSAMVNGMRSAMGNNTVMNGRIGVASFARDQSMNINQQHDLGNQLLNGLGVNGFNNLQFDWKPSP